MSDRILLGTRKGLIIIERRSNGWRTAGLAHAGAPVCYAARDPRSGAIWAALDHGHWGSKLSVSRDNGGTWADSGQVKYPEGARYAEFNIFEADESGQPKQAIRDAKLLKLWCFAFGNDDQPGRIFVGTIPGGLFASDDDGETFELNLPLWNHESRGGDMFNGDASGQSKWFGTPAAVGTGEFAPGIHSIEVDPRDSKRVLLAVSCAGVIETIDGGKTWHARNNGMKVDFMPETDAEWGHDPHLIRLSRNNPDHVWQQNHVGVFYSSDGAKTWQPVSKQGKLPHFGFPVAADADDGKSAWVVPARSDAERMTVDGSLVVCRTQDGGESWEALREGLPQEHAHDVVYRHALDIAGPRLAFGSTTGNLYVSENRGESWVPVGHNFPPIYSVRFA
jgi:hypothetical protein